MGSHQAFTEVAKAEAKIRSRVKRTSKTRYWSATLKKGYVDIGRPLSYSQAVKGFQEDTMCLQLLKQRRKL